jgi:PadR family transcriptional regulator, regulatory protein PadR
MTIQRALILRAMLEAPAAEWYGLELAQHSGLKSGTVYPALAALEESGMLVSAWEETDPVITGRPRRRLYRIGGDRLLDAQAYVAQFDVALAPRTRRRKPAGGVRVPREHPA